MTSCNKQRYNHICSVFASKTSIFMSNWTFLRSQVMDTYTSTYIYIFNFWSGLFSLIWIPRLTRKFPESYRVLPNVEPKFQILSITLQIWMVQTWKWYHWKGQRMVTLILWKNYHSSKFLIKLYHQILM